MIPAILKNMSLALEGVGYLGKVDELVPPKLVLKVEEHRAGGMDAPLELDMGMEAMVAEFSTSGLESGILAKFGARTDRLTFRGAYQDNDDNVVPVKIQMSGRFKENDMGTWTAGEKAADKAVLAVDYVEVVVDGRQLVEIDVENMIRRIDGVDQLERQRAAIEI